MSDFYQNIITEKSWQLLQELNRQIKLIIVGGWAVYLYTHALKSKDIDIIINYSDLEKLRKKFSFVKNDRLKKYEIKQEGIDIDIYLPYFSNLGVGAENLVKHTDNISSFVTLTKEALLITKQIAQFSRRGSIKGQKDRIDILSLVTLPDFDFDSYLKLLNLYHLSNLKDWLVEILNETAIVKELGLNRHFFAQRKKYILNKLFSP